MPTLRAVSKAQVPGQLREPSLLRGASFDSPMTEGPAETPSPRRYSNSALSTAELEIITQLATYLATNPFAYDSHVHLINLLHHGLANHVRQHSSPTGDRDPQSYDLLQDLQIARETMNARFALGEDLWVDWIEDQILLAGSLEDRLTAMESCQKAVEEEPSSTKIWEIYGQFMLYLYKSGNPQDVRLSHTGSMPMGYAWSDEDMVVAREVFGWQQMMSVWKQGSKETEIRMNDSHLLWDTYTELLFHDLASSLPQDPVAEAHDHYIARLKTPHATWDKTFGDYSTFVSANDNVNYEQRMVLANQLGAEAKSRYSAREVMEIKVLRASEHHKESERHAYREYLDWELAQSKRKNMFDFGLTSALYCRATLRFPADTVLWESYALFMIDETSHVHTDISVFPVLEKATRHCPWSGSLWSQYLLAAENYRLSFTEVEDIKHKATSSGLLDAGGLEEILKIQTAWCGFLRRRAFGQDSTDEDKDVAEVGIVSAIENMETLGKTRYGKDYQGDPQYRLEKIYNKYLSQAGDFTRARDVYKKLIPRKGDNFDFWIRYYLWEMSTWCKLAHNGKGLDGQNLLKPTEATKVLQRAMNRPKLDWPERIIETFQFHCEDHEDAEVLQSATAQIWKAKRIVQKRREKEAFEAYETAQAEAYKQQQQAQHDVAAVHSDAENAGKRKREDEEEAGTSKKAKAAASIELDAQVEEQQPSVSSRTKRDRENASIVVMNLPVDTTEIRLRQYFRECGTINSLNLTSDAHQESATAWIEFESKEDVRTAQTKDMSIFDDRAIEVQVDSGSKLYVCNFPPTADESWLREIFQQYGDIVDVRFPSLKYNAHRRFCYVQFRSSADAQAATKLDGKDVGGELRLVAKISDPSHRQHRQGAVYDDRELFLANLDWTASQAEIEKAFSKYGKVEKIRIPKKIDGRSRGIGFVVFSNKVSRSERFTVSSCTDIQQDEAAAALEMNLTQFKNRILNVSMSTNDKSKRDANPIITSTSHQSTASPTPGLADRDTNGGNRRAVPPTRTAGGQSKYAEMQSRTIYLLNIPDTVNEARIRAFAEPYGELVKISLRLDHQGVRLEYKDVASAGKASLGLAGQEITPGRVVGVGTEEELKQQKAEYRSDKIAVGAAKREAAKLQGPAPVRRPNNPSSRKGGKVGLGFRRGGIGLSGERTIKYVEEKAVGTNGDGGAVDIEAKAKVKSNAEFKAMFLKEEDREATT